MLRRSVLQFRLPGTIALALFFVAAAQAKSPDVRRAKPVSDDELTVAYETHDFDREDITVPRTRAVSVLVEDARTGAVLY